ncbi:MAG: 16S rRNA (cytidine(1402)-2'-O)-methyltransferase [Desulfovibrio sp.]|nr:16S rRNA (cytidine(1402)-2'-O)-methyltransferase [Desulfovibrio sp.]
MPPSHPRLWIVATPLGEVTDLSLRAREVLSAVDCILAEDTRRAQRLLASCGLPKRPLLSFFEHNEEEREAEVLARLRAGQNLALISDAGTPLLSDPGYRLVRACRREGLPVSPVPGPSAPVCALSAAGLPPLPYSFLGFLPRDLAGKRRLFTAFARTPGTLIFFERADRLAESLALALEIFGPRELAVCRELTKIHEEFIVTRLESWADLPEPLLGELTLLIGPSEERVRTPKDEVLAALACAREAGGRARDVVRRLQASVTGWTGKELYALLRELTEAERKVSAKD